MPAETTSLFRYAASLQLSATAAAWEPYMKTRTGKHGLKEVSGSGRLWKGRGVLGAFPAQLGASNYDLAKARQPATGGFACGRHNSNKH